MRLGTSLARIKAWSSWSKDVSKHGFAVFMCLFNGVVRCFIPVVGV